jgi:hypothetical protein
MSTALDVWKNPRPGTLADQVTVPEGSPLPEAPWERMTREEFAAWQAAQPAPVPQTVTRRQLLLALFRATAVTEANILAQLGAIPDAAAKYEAETEFKHATEFARTHPLVSQLASDLSLTSEQVDGIFRAAAAI